MALNIKDPDADRLAREIAQRAGESLTDAVKNSMQERVERLQRMQGRAGLASRLVAIGKRCAALPELDPRSAEDIIGYDENSLPH